MHCGCIPRWGGPDKRGWGPNGICSPFPTRWIPAEEERQEGSRDVRRASPVEPRKPPAPTITSSCCSDPFGAVGKAHPRRCALMKIPAVFALPPWPLSMTTGSRVPTSANDRGAKFDLGRHGIDVPHPALAASSYTQSAQRESARLSITGRELQRLPIYLGEIPHLESKNSAWLRPIFCESLWMGHASRHPESFGARPCNQFRKQECSESGCRP